MLNKELKLILIENNSLCLYFLIINVKWNNKEKDKKKIQKCYSNIKIENFKMDVPSLRFKCLKKIKLKV